MPYDRTKTEKAAQGMIDENFVVMLGPIEVPYLAFRKSELRRLEELIETPAEWLTAIYDIANYRLKGQLPREDFDEFVSIDMAVQYYTDNRSGSKKAATPATPAPVLN